MNTTPSTGLVRGALRAGLIALLLPLAALLAGCSTARQPYDYTAYRANMPKSILVLPPLNTSPDINAGAGVLSQVTRPLAESGYYVIPVALASETFRQNGLTVASDIHAVAPGKLREIFGADAALYLEVTKYGTQYQLIDSQTTVAVKGTLVDLRTGTQLWAGEAVASDAENRRNNSQGLVGILLSAAINQVIGNVTDASYTVAGVADRRLLEARPPAGLLEGPRSRQFKKD